MAGDDRAKSHFYRAADGLRLHVRDYDPGSTRHAPLVCLSGLTRSGDDFEPLARSLAFEAEVPRRVVAFDYRGRGRSDHDPDWHHYDLATEWRDVCAGIAVCGIGSAHFIGTSRGGLHLMAAAAAHRDIMRSVILNDIGPVLEAAGLQRIKSYVGKPAKPRDLAQAIQILKIGAGSHFTELSSREWRIFAETTFGPDQSNLGLRYDPALERLLDAFEAGEPLPELWAQFDALHDLPVLAIRGEHSDLLSPQTLAAMQARWPACEAHVVPGQGHAPLLADAPAIERIAAFLAGADG